MASKIDIPEEHRKWLASLKRSELTGLRQAIKKEFFPDRLARDRKMAAGNKRYKRNLLTQKMLTTAIEDFFPKGTTLLTLEGPNLKHVLSSTGDFYLLHVISARPNYVSTDSVNWPNGQQYYENGARVKVLFSEGRTEICPTVHYDDKREAYDWGYGHMSSGGPVIFYRTSSRTDLECLLDRVEHRLERYVAEGPTVPQPPPGSWHRPHPISGVLDSFSEARSQELKESALKLLADLEDEE